MLVIQYFEAAFFSNDNRADIARVSVLSSLEVLYSGLVFITNPKSPILAVSKN